LQQEWKLVVLKRKQTGNTAQQGSGASLAILVTEASSRCGSVCDSTYEIDHFHDFALRRLRAGR
jgi:hypothetical protein